MKNYAIKGRGAQTNPANRFDTISAEPFDDGWGSLEQACEENRSKSANQTTFYKDRNKTIVTHNNSPDLPFDQSINPYQGCEHGCIYCYARPSHNYWGMSSGLDFERKIFVKQNAAELLNKELARPGYRCRVISLGANTDPYQPIERRLEISRSIIRVLASTRHPLGIVTKSAGILRDVDVLTSMARDGLVHVYISITTLDGKLARILEPRASAPRSRLRAIERLTEAGVPVGALMAPIIPAITDHEIEHVLSACADAGAMQASRTFIRLPHDLKGLFETWLMQHYPDRARRVLSLIGQSRGGKLNDPQFFSRMSGTGAIAELISQRFDKARKKYGLDRRMWPLRTDLFEPPVGNGQMSLF